MQPLFSEARWYTRKTTNFTTNRRHLQAIGVHTPPAQGQAKNTNNPIHVNYGKFETELAGALRNMSSSKNINILE